MATEQLVIELNAKTQQLEAALTRVEGELKGVEGEAGKADKSLLSLESAGSFASASITAVATAATAASAAIAVAAAQAADYAKSLSIASNRSKESVENLQSIAYATKTVGIDLEKLGDISKDTLEKVGEFLNTGGGGFNDFAEAMGYSQREAIKAAIAFEQMSGPDVLQEMVRRMEEAGLSTIEMSAALEAVASDTTDLIPLFSDGAAELGELREEFSRVGVTLNELDIERLQVLGRELDSLGVTAQTTSAKVISILSEDIMGVGDVMTDATKMLGELVISAVTGYQAIVNEAISGIANIGREAEIKFIELRQAWNDLTGDIEESDALQKQLDILREVDVAMDSFDQEFTADAWDARTEKLEEYHEALKEKGQEELENIEENNEKKIELKQKLADAEQEINEKAADKAAKNEKKLLKEQEKNARKEELEKKRLNKQKQKADDDYYNAASTIGNLLFEDNKAYQIASVIVDTARGISRQFADLPYPAAIASSVAVAATGIAQIAAISSASKGGGGSVGGVATASSSAESAEVEALPAPDTVQVSGTVTSGGSSTGGGGAITITSDDSDDLATAFAAVLNKKIQSGEVSLG